MSADEETVLDLFRLGRPTHVDPRERQMSIAYADVFTALGRDHHRAQRTLRDLELAGRIEWLPNGQLIKPPRRSYRHEDWHNVHRARGS